MKIIGHIAGDPTALHDAINVHVASWLSYPNPNGGHDFVALPCAHTARRALAAIDGVTLHPDVHDPAPLVARSLALLAHADVHNGHTMRDAAHRLAEHHGDDLFRPDT